MASSVALYLTRGSEEVKYNQRRIHNVIHLVFMDSEDNLIAKYELDVTVIIPRTGRIISMVMDDEWDPERWRKMVYGRGKPDNYYFFRTEGGSVKCKYYEGKFTLVDKRLTSGERVSRVKLHAEGISTDTLMEFSELMKEIRNENEIEYIMNDVSK